MKTTKELPGMQLGKEELEKITKEVKETLAFGYQQHRPVFGAVDLWNIQRHKKNIQPRGLHKNIDW